MPYDDYPSEDIVLQDRVDLVPALDSADEAALLDLIGAQSAPSVTVTATQMLGLIPEIHVGQHVENFAIPSGDGKPVLVDTFKAIICGTADYRVFWDPEAEEGSTEPPLCKSENAIKGFGPDSENRWRACAACPRAQFKDNGEGSEAPDCTSRKLLYVYPVIKDENGVYDTMPGTSGLVLDCAPTSIANINTATLPLAVAAQRVAAGSVSLSNATTFGTAIAEFSLEHLRNGPYKYVKLVVTIRGRVDDLALTLRAMKQAKDYMDLRESVTNRWAESGLSL